MDSKKIMAAVLAVTMTGAFIFVPEKTERNATVFAAEETDDFSWLPHNDEEYKDFIEKYTTTACLNGYIILSKDPCADGGYSITESHEGTAEYYLYKQYNVRTGVLAPGTSPLPINIYKPKKPGLLKITWKVERTWSKTEPAIWEAVKYYSVADDLSVKEITEEEYNNNLKNDPTDVSYPTNFDEYRKAVENNPDMYMSDGKTVYFLNPSINSAEQKLIVNTNNKAEVSHETYGYVFTPDINGKYIISSEEYHETTTDTADVDVIDEHLYSRRVTNYIVTAENGEISVTKLGRYEGETRDSSYYDEKQYTLFKSTYNAFSGGNIREDNYFRYVCSEFKTDVKLVMKTRFNSEYDNDIEFLENADKGILEKYTSAGSMSADFTICPPDMMNSYVISAAEGSEGNIVIINKENNISYSIEIRDGQIVPETFKTVTSQDTIQGDCNNDGTVNVLDISAMIKYLIGKEDIKPGDGSDLNNDGKINIIDLCILKNILLGK